MDKKYMHVETGSVDTREGWIASYDKEELEQRGLTAEQAFAADEGKTLVESDITLQDLIDEHGATGVIRIDAGNGSAGPVWVEWDDDTARDMGDVEMTRVAATDPAYEDADVTDTILDAMRDVLGKEHDGGGEIYASEWIEDDDRNYPYQATNPYRYRLIF